MYQFKNKFYFCIWYCKCISKIFLLVHTYGIFPKKHLKKIILHIWNFFFVLWRFSVRLGKSILGTRETTLGTLATLLRAGEPALPGCFIIFIDTLKKWLLRRCSSALNTWKTIHIVLQLRKSIHLKLINQNSITKNISIR